MNTPSEAAKQESSRSTTTTNARPSNPLSSSTSSWSRSKDPRIVRVSRVFGGKDRHSKVCTVRGLRDRRVRLSAPTAIQLYDLQDRLGLNQPSKVVDWLLNAAKREIDELPPLKIPPNFEFMVSQPEKQGRNMFLGKPKDVSGETSGQRDENWARNDEQERRFANQEPYVVSANNINFDISRQNPPSLMNCNNNIALYNSFGRWDPSNLSLSHHPPAGRSTAHPNEDLHNCGLVPLPPMLSGSSSSAAAHQVLVYQPEVSTQSYFPIEFDPKQSSFQISPHLPAVRPSHFSMNTANLLPSQDNAVDDHQQSKHSDFHLGQP